MVSIFEERSQKINKSSENIFQKRADQNSFSFVSPEMEERFPEDVKSGLTKGIRPLVDASERISAQHLGNAGLMNQNHLGSDPEIANRVRQITGRNNPRTTEQFDILTGNRGHPQNQIEQAVSAYPFGQVAPFAVGGGLAAKNLGAPQWLQTAIETLGFLGGEGFNVPGRVKTNISEFANKKFPEPPPSSKNTSSQGKPSPGGGSSSPTPEYVNETLPSGLTKHQAVGEAHASKGIITPERQKFVIKKLNEEAAGLTKTAIHKNLPLAQKIEEGFDFQSDYRQKFGELQKIAEKANPQIDPKPIQQFLAETRKKYQGIPDPHPNAKRILQNSKRMRNLNPTLKNLLRTYRSNNDTIGEIAETSRFTGRKAEYVDYLINQNRAISKSIESTLPENSSWVKQFKSLNSEYGQYKKTVKTLDALESILQERASPSTIKKFATDKKLQKKLQYSMGEKGTNEVIQIAKDLELAQKSIKNIQAKKISAWDAALPLGVFIPGFHIPGAMAGAKKIFDLGRRGYGYLLSTPARRLATHEALKAIEKGDLKAYEKAAEDLK